MGFGKTGMRLWTTFFWLRIGSSGGGLIWTW